MVLVLVTKKALVRAEAVVGMLVDDLAVDVRVGVLADVGVVILVVAAITLELVVAVSSSIDAEVEVLIDA